MSTLQTKADVADLLKTSTCEVDRLVKLGRLPKPIQVGPYKPRWRAAELETFLSNLS
jgi:predicted DNA-binding transcriptional regulator AlpA